MIDGKPDMVPEVEKVTDLKKQGKYLAGLCPLHQEKTKSFFVNEEKQTARCYGCGFYGDIIDFTMKLHGLPFKDALVYLGIKPGKKPLPDPAIERKKQIQKDYERAINNLYESLCGQARYFHKLRIGVQANSGALTEAGMIHFAERMGVLAAIDYKLDSIMKGTFEDKIFILTEANKNNVTCGKTFRHAA